MSVIYQDVKLERGYRIDLLVENQIVVELKAGEQITPVHDATALTDLKLANKALGLLINFNVAVLKDGIRRYIWQEKKEFIREATGVCRENATEIHG